MKKSKLNIFIMTRIVVFFVLAMVFQFLPNTASTAQAEDLLQLSSVSSTWQNGYNMTITIKNNSSDPVNGWTLSLNKSEFTITNIWSARSSTSGDTIIITPEKWNTVINPGDKISFGLICQGILVNNFYYKLSSSDIITPSITPIITISPTPKISATPTPTSTPTPTPTQTTPIKIMPLGDSITDGVFIPGGYRIKLWNNIVKDGGRVDFVGSSSNGPAELTDKNHEGHSGWRIDQIDSSINGWMDSYKPQIVLLHIGTNDISQNYSLASAPNRLSGLVDKICNKLPANGKVYVAQLIPLGYGDAQNLINYNNSVADIVRNKSSQGKPVYLVDMYHALTTSDLSDSVHPNRNGYDKMADTWYNAIRKDIIGR